MAISAKQTNALITKYAKLYEKKYGISPLMNRYKEKWGFQDMISDLGYDKAQEVVEHFFKTENPGHRIVSLFRNYDSMAEALDEQKEDADRRERIRRETQERVRRWEEMNGKR